MTPAIRPDAVIVLAAGQGTRMRSKTPKVLHRLGGRSMVGHVLAAVQDLQPGSVVVVVGHERERVGTHVNELLPDALLAVQDPQQGTGQAVALAMEALDARTKDAGEGAILVLAADTPLIESTTLQALLDDHAEGSRAVTVLSSTVERPFGYGRIQRDESGALTAIVEEKDATDEQRAIREINSGVFAFDGPFLRQALGRIGNDNAKGEYYLTDVVAVARQDGVAAAPYSFADAAQTEGANDRIQLAELAAALNQRTLRRWMRDGVTVVDPRTTWVDSDVVLGQDVTLLPGVQLLGATVVAEDAVIGPDSTLKDVEVGRNASVVRTHATLAVIGEGATIGPFSYLRPGTVVGAGGKVGAYVETKNVQIGAGAKVPHLSYVGDATIGEGTNIGAGTIVANYDGVNKHRTTVGAHARTGSNNTFIAPVTIGDGAVTGGGTTVREDVPPGALAVSAGPQRTIAGWVAKNRPGTPSADAAAATEGAAGGSEVAPPPPEG